MEVSASPETKPGLNKQLIFAQLVPEAEIREATKTYDEARERLVKVNLPIHFEHQYPDAWAGVKEGLLCINKTGWCDQVPTSLAVLSRI